MEEEFVDYYCDLSGIAGPGASPKELRLAFYTALRQNHPDKTGDASTNEKTARILKARDALKAMDYETRLAYDRKWKQEMERRAISNGRVQEENNDNGEEMETAPMNDTESSLDEFTNDGDVTMGDTKSSLDEFTNGGDVTMDAANSNPNAEAGLSNSAEPGGSQSTDDNENASDAPLVEYLDVTLEEVFTGCQKTVRSARKLVQSDGTTKTVPYERIINVPPGCHFGLKIVHPQEDYNDGSKLIPELIIIFRGRSHEHFVRDNSDIWYFQKISLKEALCGCEFSVPTLMSHDTKKVETGDEIVPPNKCLTYKGEGLPVYRDPSNKKGDFIISYIIEFPESLSQNDKEEIRKLLENSTL